jgi:hypothetical protein
MDDVTNGTAAALYSADHAGQNSPHQLRGTLLTFSDKQYFAGVGQYRTEVPIGTRFVALEARAGWRRWESGKVVEFIAEIDGRYPQRHQLGHDDPREWGPGPGGKLADPWQDAREVVLIREVDFSEYTLAIATGGGRAAIDHLRNSMANARVLRPDQFPIVELQWRPMQTSYGMKAKPDLKIVGWWRPETTSIAPPNDLNDAIPDLTK